MHWNAEGVMNKKEELEYILQEESINICCIQETHLSKGGILTLVRNNIDRSETAVHMEGAEYQMIWAKLNDTELHILNFYCPDNQPLSLNTINTLNSSFIAVGDLITVTPRAGSTVR